MRIKNVEILRTILAVSLCLLVSACVSARPPSPNAPPPSPVEMAPPPPAVEEPGTRGNGGTLPRQHLWDQLLQMGAEDPGYGMYTYVLFGRRLDLRSGLDQEALQRYEQLLTAIVGSTLSSADAGELSAEDKQATNLLYIPGTVRGSVPTLSNYNSALAMRSLVALGRLIREDNQPVAEKLATRAGPFLVSTLKPIGAIDERQSTLLYADLSSTNPAAMAEIVAAYKLRVSRSNLEEVEQFAPLRLALLNLVLNADDNITLVKAALAVWIPQ